jgi:hypothetical protein
MRNVRTSDTKVDKAPNKMTIPSGIVERLTMSGAQVNTKLHRCISCASISDSITRKDILNVLLLGEVDAIKHRRDLNTEEVTKGFQIRSRIYH